MLKRRSSWLGGGGALLLVLSLSGVAAGATPPDAEPEPVLVDTTATFEDLDGNGVDDDCQEGEVTEDADAAAAELLTVDVDGNGVISTTEAAHSGRIGGKNCNHGGYVSWIAHQDECAVEPTEPVAEGPTDGETVVPVVTTPPDAEPDVEPCESEDTPVITAAKKDKVAAAAAREAKKAERKLARETAKAERTLARETAKAERTLARETARAERQAAKAERQAAKAARQAERQAAKAARQAKHKKNH
jgi:hypothetical protein